MVALGLAPNDCFDVVRRGEPPAESEPSFRSRREVSSFLKRAGRERVRSIAEGRWSLLPWGQPDVEEVAGQTSNGATTKRWISPIRRDACGSPRTRTAGSWSWDTT